MQVIRDIARAQQFLRGQYGEDGYKTLVSRLKAKVARCWPDLPELAVLKAMANDETAPAAMRILAIATMGE